MTTGWHAVADKINARLRELAWDQIELVRVAGVSDTTVRQLQTAGKERYKPSTLGKVSKALGWTADSIDRIREGGEPVEADMLIIGENRRTDGEVDVWVGEGPVLPAEDRDIVLAALDGAENLDPETRERVKRRFREIIAEAEAAAKSTPT